jgi:predicted ATP-grasp superfamily ATP-dependent carboligase
VESIGFDGMVEVEFKFDPRDGKYKILDVNPRPWAWHRLSKAAGADFAYLLWKQKVGLDVSPIPALRRAAWIREATDLMAIVKSPDRTAEIKRLLKALLRGKISLATFKLLDSVPFFAELALWALRGVSRQKMANVFVTDVSRIGISNEAP